MHYKGTDVGDTTKKEVIKTEGLFGHKRRGEELEISELLSAVGS